MTIQEQLNSAASRASCVEAHLEVFLKALNWLLAPS
jgi:hypothetical protein